MGTTPRGSRSSTRSSGSSPGWGDADMALKHLGYVDLPLHVGSGGFDHAAVYQATGRVYVAHTAHDAIDVIDMPTRKHVVTIYRLTDVAVTQQVDRRARY